jgi:hypothetical protein
MLYNEVLWFISQNKTLKENYETTVQKLEECRELLKTNENGKYMSLFYLYTIFDITLIDVTVLVQLR